jgi:hypothetical protein
MGQSIASELQRPAQKIAWSSKSTPFNAGKHESSIMEVGYINLIYRTDRDKEIQSELKRMHAICDNIVKLHVTLDPISGAMGCAKSHLRLLQMFASRYQNANQYIMILEDDFKIVMPLHKAKKLIEIFTTKLTSSPVLMIQCNPSKVKPLVMTDTENVDKIDTSGFVQVQYALCTAGYIVRADYLPNLITNVLQSICKRRPIDVGYLELQQEACRKSPWLALQPPMGIQRPSFSDIEGKFKNYRI